ncbi:MAG: S9 family peptidase, partial [Candidatus Eisenbacteria bacterium]|nr:S9 family peptidase [Candidatus Eisenbacteria bacterium]
MRRTTRALCATLAVALLATPAALTPFSARALADMSQVQPEPPAAAQTAVADTLFGDVRVDEYYWLRERGGPEVLGYLEAENAYTDAMTAHLEGLQETIYEEMVGRIKETDLSVPYLDNGYFYYERTEEGKSYPILCRKKSLDAEEEVLLDQNALSEGHGFFEVWMTTVSPDNALMAYAADTTGAEVYTIYVKDLATGELLPDVIDHADYGLEWAADSRTLFYLTMDEARRPDKLWRHTLGTDPTEDKLVFHETDPGYSVWVDKTRSNEYLIMSVGSRDTEEAYLLKADDPYGQFVLVAPRVDGVEYYLSHHGDEFYVRTNQDAKNFKVMKAPSDAPSKENWVTVIPERKDVKIERIDTFADHLIVTERERGRRNIRVMNLSDGAEHYIDFPEPVYAVYLRDNAEYDTSELRFAYQSYVTPESVFDYDTRDRTRALLKQREVLGGYDPALYKSERLFATASDGTEIPV